MPRDLCRKGLFAGQKKSLGLTARLYCLLRVHTCRVCRVGPARVDRVGRFGWIGWIRYASLGPA